jgi:antitoxin MazE
MTQAVVNIQRWGNSLAIRVPVAIARPLNLRFGTPVELTVEGDTLVARVAGEQKLSLFQKLQAFDPEKHLPFGNYK